MKQKHAHFSIRLCVFSGLIVLIAVFLTHGIRIRMNRQTPADAVNQYLSQIPDVSSDFIDVYLPSDHTHTDSSAAKAASLLFEHFSWKILETHIDGDTASVDVRLSNIDMKQLARDLCRDMTKRAARLSSASLSVLSENDYYDLLSRTLSSNTYPLTDIPVRLKLFLSDNVWVVEKSSDLSSSLSGHFADYMKDPDTFGPDEVLTVYLDEFRSLDANGWLTCLHLSDTFSTYSSSYSSELDLAYAEKIADYFNYSIAGVSRTENTAMIDVNITSIDMHQVLSVYQEKLLDYAKTGDSITGDAAALSDAAALYLKEALQECDVSAARTITVPVSYDGYTWHPQITEELADALLGNLDEALKAFTETS